MPHDHVTRACVPEHGGRKVAGESPADLGMTILSPEAELAALDPPGGLRDQRRRRADEELGVAGFARIRRLPHGVDLNQRPAKAIHLPVSRDQRANARSYSGLSAT